MADVDDEYRPRTDEEKQALFHVSEKKQEQIKEIHDDTYRLTKYSSVPPLEEGENQQALFVLSQIGAGKSYTIKALTGFLNDNFGNNSFVPIDTDTCKPFTPTYTYWRKLDEKAKAQGKTTRLVPEAEFLKFLEEKKLSTVRDEYGDLKLPKNDMGMETIPTDDKGAVVLPNYTRLSAHDSDALCQEALEYQGQSGRNHVLCEAAVRNSSAKKTEAKLLAFDREADVSAVILAVPEAVSLTSIFLRAEKNYYNKDEVYIPAEVNVHDESYSQMPAIVDEFFHKGYFDNVVVVDRNQQVHFDSSNQSDAENAKTSIVDKIAEARQAYYTDHPDYRKEIEADWKYIFDSMTERKAAPEDRKKAEEAYSRVMKQLDEIDKSLSQGKTSKKEQTKPTLETAVRNLRRRSGRNSGM